MIAIIAMLIGLVMLMSGRGGIRVGEQIGLVIVVFIVLAMLFGFAVSRAL